MFKAKNELEREIWVKCFRLNQALEESEKEIHIEENLYQSVIDREHNFTKPSKID